MDLDAFSWIQLHLTGFSWFYDNKIPIHMVCMYGMYGMVWYGMVWYGMVW